MNDYGALYDEIVAAAEQAYTSDGPGKRYGLMVPETLWDFIVTEIGSVVDDSMTPIQAYREAARVVEAIERDAQAVRFAIEAAQKGIMVDEVVSQ